MVKLVMNRLKPMYILLFSFVLFLYSIINLNLVNNKLTQTKKESTKYLKIANKYKDLKISWGDIKNQEKRIYSIIKISNIQNANIVKTGKTIKIDIKNLTPRVLDKFINKILNEKIVVDNLILTKSSLTMEVGI